MTAFSQSTNFASTVEEPISAGPDLLAGGLLNSLSRHWGDFRFWRPVKTLIIGGITFGLAPLLVWPKRFREFIGAEQQQLWHLAEWMRLRGGTVEAQQLRDVAERIRFRPVLWMISLLTAAGVVAAFLMRYGPIDDLSVLLRATYFRISEHRPPVRSPTDVEFNFIWSIGLALAYMMHWLQVQLHLADMRRFVARFNRLVGFEQIAPIALPDMGWGIRPMWIAGAIVMMACGALWALPMMLAGAAHRRYITHASGPLRARLAERVRAILVRQRPSMRVPQPVWIRRTCENRLCQASIAPGARFCPRCGTPIVEMVNAVA
jgi:hypothetical protein